MVGAKYYLLLVLVLRALGTLPIGSYSPEQFRSGIVHITYTGTLPAGVPLQITATSTFTNPMPGSSYNLAYGLIGVSMGNRLNFDAIANGTSQYSFITRVDIFNSSLSASFSYSFRLSYLAMAGGTPPYMVLLVGSLNLTGLTIDIKTVNLVTVVHPLPPSLVIPPSTTTISFVQAIACNTPGLVFSVIEQLNTTAPASLYITISGTNSTYFRMSYIIWDSLASTTNTVFQMEGSYTVPTGITIFNHQLQAGLFGLYILADNNTFDCSIEPNVSCSNLTVSSRISFVVLEHPGCPAYSLQTTFCTCNAGHYENIAECSACSYTCSTCVSLPYNCSSCVAGSYRQLSLATNSCICQPGTYDAEVSICQTCISPCLTCSSAWTCTSCVLTSGTSLVSGTCVCPNGLYYNSASSVCQACSIYCLTCNASSTYCLTCDSSLFRSLSNISNNSICVCSVRYYENTAASPYVCSPCTQGCLSCTSVTSCSLCDAPNFFTLVFGQCVCSLGYYLSPPTCSACVPGCANCTSSTNCVRCTCTVMTVVSGSCVCPTGRYMISPTLCGTCSVGCVTCTSATICTVCNSNMSRVLNNITNTCDCMTGYYLGYPNGTTVSTCSKCPIECLVCTAMTSCSSCASGYTPNGIGGCVQLSPITWQLQQFALGVNLIQVSIDFSQNQVILLPSAATAFVVTLGDEPVPYAVQFQNGSQVRLSVSLTTTPTVLSVSIPAGSVSSMPASSQSLSVAAQYNYSPTQVKMLTGVKDTFNSVADGLTYGCSFLLVVGLASMLIDMIEFIQIISLYIFLDTDLPANLLVVLQGFYEQLNMSVMPITLPDWFGSTGATFSPPANYQKYDFDINMLSANFLSLAQSFVMIAYYCLFKRLFSKVHTSYSVVNWFKAKFVPRLYSNVSQVLLGSQMVLCFSAAAALLDRRLDSWYKVVNIALALNLVFLAGMLPVAIHPVALKSIKTRSLEQTQDCYSKALRHKSGSERYVMSGMLSRVTVALSIPLLPATVSLVLMTISSIWQLYCSTRTTFERKIIKILRIAYGAVFLLINLLVGAIIANNTLHFLNASAVVLVGYVCIALIMLNVLRELLEVAIQVFLGIRTVFRAIRRMCKKVAPKKENLKIQVILNGENEFATPNNELTGVVEVSGQKQTEESPCILRQSNAVVKSAFKQRQRMHENSPKREKAIAFVLQN